MTGTGEAFRYPIGRFMLPEHVSAGDRARWIEEIAPLPIHWHGTVDGLSDEPSAWAELADARRAPLGDSLDLLRSLAHNAWHGKHLLAHITSFRRREKWCARRE